MSQRNCPLRRKLFAGSFEFEKLRTSEAKPFHKRILETHADIHIITSNVRIGTKSSGSIRDCVVSAGFHQFGHIAFVIKCTQELTE